MAGLIVSDSEAGRCISSLKSSVAICYNARMYTQTPHLQLMVLTPEQVDNFMIEWKNALAVNPPRLQVVPDEMLQICSNQVDYSQITRDLSA
jgi:hypothetical protein